MRIVLAPAPVREKRPGPWRSSRLPNRHAPPSLTSPTSLSKAAAFIDCPLCAGVPGKAKLNSEHAKRGSRTQSRYVRMSRLNVNIPVAGKLISNRRGSNRNANAAVGIVNPSLPPGIAFTSFATSSTSSTSTSLPPTFQSASLTPAVKVDTITIKLRTSALRSKFAESNLTIANNTRVPESGMPSAAAKATDASPKPFRERRDRQTSSDLNAIDSSSQDNCPSPI